MIAFNLKNPHYLNQGLDIDDLDHFIKIKLMLGTLDSYIIFLASISHFLKSYLDARVEITARNCLCYLIMPLIVFSVFALNGGRKPIMPAGDADPFSQQEARVNSTMQAAG